MRKIFILFICISFATELEVDGGINVDTVRQVVEAGADVIVAGSAVYNQHYTVAQNIKNIRERIS